MYLKSCSAPTHKTLEILGSLPTPDDYTSSLGVNFIPSTTSFEGVRTTPDNDFFTLDNSVLSVFFTIFVIGFWYSSRDRSSSSKFQELVSGNLQGRKL